MIKQLENTGFSIESSYYLNKTKFISAGVKEIQSLCSANDVLVILLCNKK